MATDTRTVAPTQGTDAAFRAWINAIEAALAAVGLVPVTATGEINTTTVTRPTVADSDKGFRIFRFADTLQATKPIFIRLDYGSGNASTKPQIKFNVGTEHDGAGRLDLGGTYLSTDGAGKGFSMHNTFTANATARTIYTSGIQSGAEGYVNFLLWPGQGTGAQVGMGAFFSIERTRNNDGVNTGAGFVVTYWPGTDGADYQPLVTFFTHDVAGVPTAVSDLPSTYRGDFTGVVGADVYLSPVFVEGMTTGRVYPPSLALLIYRHADIARNTNISVSMYGASHTFKCLGDWARKARWVRGSGTAETSNAVAMRWE